MNCCFHNWKMLEFNSLMKCSSCEMVSFKKWNPKRYCKCNNNPNINLTPCTSCGGMVTHM